LLAVAAFRKLSEFFTFCVTAFLIEMCKKVYFCLHKSDHFQAAVNTLRTQKEPLHYTKKTLQQWQAASESESAAALGKSWANVGKIGRPGSCLHVAL